MSETHDTIEAALREDIARLQAGLQAAEARARDLQEKLDAALDGTGLCLWQGHPATGTLQVFNLQDFQPGDMAPHFDLWCAKLHPEDREAVLANYHAHLDGRTPCYEVEYRTLGPDGRVTWLWDHGRVIERAADGSALRIMGAHADITRRKEAERELAWLAHNDALTGLPNRARFFGLLEQALGEVRRDALQLAVLFLDLDYFKDVNDRHGHAIGDRVLLAVAGQLRDILPRGDCVARLGGDEFTLLLKGGQIVDKARDIAARILEALSPPLCVDGQSIRLGASIGVSLFPEHGETAEALVLHADSAMYRAKSRGRHRIAFYQAGQTAFRHGEA